MKTRFLILDMHNLFIRNFVVNPTLSANTGDPIGGVIGSLRSLQKLARMFQPSHIFAVWDGSGGSRKRRQKQKDYKSGRKPLNLNRAIDLQPDEIEQNKLWQMLRLREYIADFPIIQLQFDSTEADDVIAHLVSKYPEQQKVIVSSDKDFIQLLQNNTTLLYRPIQDVILHRKNVTQEFGIQPCNFAIARAVVGDKSDNITGLRGVGLKTLAKRFPELGEPRDIYITELVSMAQKRLAEKSLKIYEQIANGTKIIQKNYEIIQLYRPMVTPQITMVIERVVKEFEPQFAKTNTFKRLARDGADVDFTGLFQYFQSLEWDQPKI